MVTTQTTAITHTANGATTIFAFDFFAFPGTVHVAVDGAELATLLFTATGFLSNTGGSVTLLTAPADGAMVRVWRRTPLAQDYDFQYNEQMPSRVIGGALDRLICIVQEQRAWFKAIQDGLDWLRNAFNKLSNTVTSALDAFSLRLDSFSNDLTNLANTKADKTDPRFHTHENLSALDEIGSSNGAPTWNGQPWPVSGGPLFDEIDLTPQADGALTVFDAGTTLAPSMPIVLYYGGQRQVEGVNYTIDYQDNTITTLFDEPVDDDDNRKLILVIGDAVSFPPNAAAFPVTGHDTSITNPSPGILDVDAEELWAPSPTMPGQTGQVVTMVDLWHDFIGHIFPVGCVHLTANPGDVNLLIGFGVWERVAKGSALVGVDEGDPDFNQPEKTAGSKTTTIAKANLPSVPLSIAQQPLQMNPVPDHKHTGTLQTYARVGTGALNKISDSGSTQTSSATYTTDSAGGHTPSGVVPSHATENMGDGAPLNNLQPSYAIYIWKRTA